MFDDISLHFAWENAVLMVVGILLLTSDKPWATRLWARFRHTPIAAATPPIDPIAELRDKAGLRRRESTVEGTLFWVIRDDSGDCQAFTRLASVNSKEEAIDEAKKNATTKVFVVQVLSSFVLSEHRWGGA